MALALTRNIVLRFSQNMGVFTGAGGIAKIGRLAVQIMMTSR